MIDMEKNTYENNTFADIDISLRQTRQDLKELHSQIEFLVRCATTKKREEALRKMAEDIEDRMEKLDERRGYFREMEEEGEL